ncbi:hypothetical protein RFI_09172 [Reticulomyxa filosa]|uniref:Uncharacterized protein n=1 Tax=Reticulomyxa filosa TaxID=46433 RepID=X6NPX2_RETFI|nr:hypothetical protein RFI_09172 [Reticulomyxa filosa]|eukprot:ETO27963.1 hypothetical protein RFI_09172 [Reticulomyxa filosa]
MNTPHAYMMGKIGDMFYALSRGPASALTKWTERNADGFVEKIGGKTRSESRHRFYKMLFLTSLGMTGTAIYFSVYPPSAEFSRKFGIAGGSTVGQAKRELTGLFHDRVEKGLSNAMKFAMVGDVAMMSTFLQAVEEIVLEHPEELGSVRLSAEELSHYQQQLQSQLLTPSQVQQLVLKPLLDEIDIFEVEKEEKSTTSPQTRIEIKQRSKTHTDNILSASTDKEQHEALIVLSPDDLKTRIHERQLATMDSHASTVVQNTLHFRSLIDYINHVGICNRCVNLINRAKRYAKHGSIQECANTLADLWETIDAHPFPIFLSVSKVIVKLTLIFFSISCYFYP